jgi:hypothetical protein
MTKSKNKYLHSDYLSSNLGDSEVHRTGFFTYGIHTLVGKIQHNAEEPQCKSAVSCITEVLKDLED